MEFTKCSDVRLAELDDLPNLMAITKTACEEDGQHSYDPEKVLNMLRRYFDKAGGLVAVIGEKGKPLKGYLIMIIDEVWYSKETQLLELSLFVHPDHRKSTYARQLMEFSKQASNGLKMDLTIGVMSTSRTEAKVRLYQRQFPQVGCYFVYRPQA